ncbi:C4-dicarboxylate-binding protein DctP [Paenibacillus algorifonticola]|uniref:C4-dicarboxylate-binding protein DctP n=1 Tax=Paenibacillus algorifonticola TaxID=684063 RepID=A0A1I2IDK5_9BACL|nr:DctP family TRAP transporter solute-binding subunit [Paenibacillus algorifonticola]SFF40385.1 C4-dicarboxylate-binding protein DctP [Paenibacillus algorifonticola]
MKTAIGMISFIAVGLLAAILFGFRPEATRSLPFDEEQTGLKERIVIKFSHVVAENTPKGLAATHFAKLVKEKTDDAVEIQVFPNGMLYTEDTEVAALKRGDIQMIAPAYSNLSVIDPAWLIMDLPFAFADQQAVDSALDSKLGQLLFASMEQHHIKGVAFWSNGFKQMTDSVRPLRIPDDFKGLNFRILPSDVLVSQFQALGATTAKIPFNEVFASLKKGIVDGQENTISNIFTKQLYQTQHYMTISNHGYLGYGVMFNESFWDELPPGIQAELQSALVETTEWMKQNTAAMQEQQLRQLKQSKDIDIHTLTPQEREQWVQAFQPIYDQYREIIGEPLMNEIARPK